MYQDNVYRTFNIWRDGDILHIFLTVPLKKYEQYKKTIHYVKGILGMNFNLDAFVANITAFILVFSSLIVKYRCPLE